MEWIDVNERLPEPGQMVVALFPSLHKQMRNTEPGAEHDGNGGHILYGCAVRQLVPRSSPTCRWADEGITHWMPFDPPESP